MYGFVQRLERFGEQWWIYSNFDDNIILLALFSFDDHFSCGWLGEIKMTKNDRMKNCSPTLFVSQCELDELQRLATILEKNSVEQFFISPFFGIFTPFQLRISIRSSKSHIQDVINTCIQSPTLNMVINTKKGQWYYVVINITVHSSNYMIHIVQLVV